jgi:hypothetical protein
MIRQFLMDRLCLNGGKAEDKPDKDIKTLQAFTKVYCRQHHGTRGDLCPECDDLLQYAIQRRERCPYDPKPACKNCQTHCYKPEYRQKIREVMKFSGIYFVKRGRIDWMIKYFLT